MGLADAMIKMGIKYGSPEAIEISDRIGMNLARDAISESAILAKEHKCTYPKYDKRVLKSNFYKVHEVEEVKDYGLYNSQLLTIAPTGTISTMIGVSGGIEPIFANSYTRTTKSLHGHDETYKIYTPIVDKYMKENNLTEEEQLPDYFVTSSTISVDERIAMQSIWQKHIDASISSTINLPHETTVEAIENLYMNAWKAGLKGVTVYRAGCAREGILVVDNKAITKEEKEEQELKWGSVVKCSDNLIGKKRKLVSGCGSLHVSAWFDPKTKKLMETYFNKGSSGGCVSAETEFFNGKTWKQIKDYTEGDYVLQYNEDGSASLVQPISYIVNDNIKTLKEFSNKYLSMVLSEDHRMYLYKNYRHFKNGRDSKLNSEIITVKEYLSEKKERHLPTTFTYESDGIPLTDEQIKLCVAFYADGTICNENSKYCSIVISKDRKKERLLSILQDNNIDYEIFDYESTKDKNYLTYKFYVNQNNTFDEYLLDKQFTAKWYNCNKHQKELILDEIQYWDGSKESGNRGTCFTSNKDEEIDFIQFIASSCGYRATISAIKNAKRVRFNNNLTILGIKDMTVNDIPTTDNKSYCFSVPSGLLVLRYKGNIFITGNCNNFMIGLSRMVSLACRAGVDVYTIKDQLDSTGVCPSYATRRATKNDVSRGTCCPMAIGNALVEMYEELINENPIIMPEVKQEKKETVEEYTKCPECGAKLNIEGGCRSCPECGFSYCS